MLPLGPEGRGQLRLDETLARPTNMLYISLSRNDLEKGLIFHACTAPFIPGYLWGVGGGVVAHEDGDNSISPQFSLPVVHT